MVLVERAPLPGEQRVERVVEVVVPLAVVAARLRLRDQVDAERPVVARPEHRLRGPARRLPSGRDRAGVLWTSQSISPKQKHEWREHHWRDYPD